MWHFCPHLYRVSSMPWTLIYMPMALKFDKNRYFLTYDTNNSYISNKVFLSDVDLPVPLNRVTNKTSCTSAIVPCCCSESIYQVILITPPSAVSWLGYTISSLYWRHFVDCHVNWLLLRCSWNKKVNMLGLSCYFALLLAFSHIFHTIIFVKTYRYKRGPPYRHIILTLSPICWTESQCR